MVRAQKEQRMAERLLLVLPSVIRKVDEELEIDVDFSESVRLYLDSFDSISVACPVTMEFQDSGLRRCRRVKDLPWGNRVEFIPLPNAYRLGALIRQFRTVRKLLVDQIGRADFLVFSPHTLIGDWPTVAIREAVRLKRPYVIEADVVYEKVSQVGWDRLPAWKRFLQKRVLLPLFQRRHKYCLEHSALALFQGQDVYDAYAPSCSNPYKVYHISICDEDYITTAQLEKKLNCVDQGMPLKLCYVGRAIDMKGPMDWLKVVDVLIKSGVKINAVWMGDGSLLPRMQESVEELGLAANVMLPGYVSDRREILKTLQDGDIFLFCHKTPESPRCLVEALASGCPLVGYTSGYPQELVSQYGGGRFAPLGRWEELADIVRALNKDRNSLRELIRLASESGRLYERDATMQRRIDLIKDQMSPGNIRATPKVDYLH
jgi:glycosyltransferase involved in cell wall biosynthesis